MHYAQLSHKSKGKYKHLNKNNKDEIESKWKGKEKNPTLLKKSQRSEMVSEEGASLGNKLRCKKHPNKNNESKEGCEAIQKNLQLTKRDTKEGKINSIRKLIIFKVNDIESPTLSVYDLTNNIWNEEREIPSWNKDYRCSCIACFNDNVYFVIQNSFFFVEFHVYEIKNNSFTQIAQRKTFGSVGYAVEWNNFLYLFHQDITFKNLIIERYDPKEAVWESVSQYRKGFRFSCGPSFGVFDHSLYFTVDDKLCRLFDCKQGIELVPIEFPEKPKYLKIAEGNSKVYIIGCTRPKCVYIFDPETNVLEKQVIPVNLRKCKAMLNLRSPEKLEILVVGYGMSYIYHPPSSWKEFVHLDSSSHCLSVMVTNTK